MPNNLKKKVEQPDLEIVVSTYWPTRIIKSISVKDPDRDRHFRNSIDLSKSQAEYLYKHLKTIFEKGESDE